MKWPLPIQLAILAVGVCWLSATAAPNNSAISRELSGTGLDPVESERLRQFAREQQDQFRKRVTIPVEATRSATALGMSAQLGNPRPRISIQLHPSADAMAQARQFLWFATAAMLIGLIAFRRYAPEITTTINKKFNPWAMSPVLARRFAAQARAEEACFAEFLAAFRVGPTAPPPTTVAPQTEMVQVLEEPAAKAAEPVPESRTIKDFFAGTPKRLDSLQKLLGEIREAKPATSGQRALIEEFGRQVTALRELAGFPELLPAQQMIGALEGLIKQFLSKASYVTASTLRTAGISLDMLQELCVPDLPPTLITSPPIRLLAVDDDLVTCHALSWSLSKALSRPDLADNGDAALALVAKEAYDVIFLDVQMPGMDGFELCSRIHETELNRITPVVFVTGQSDFDSRAESALRGGVDLIAKPFLTFEITIIALSLALRRRLQARRQPKQDAAVQTQAKASSAQPRHAPAKRRQVKPQAATSTPPRPASADASLPAGLPANSTVVPAHTAAPAHEPARAFFKQAPADLHLYQQLAHSLLLTEDTQTRQDKLEDLYLFIHSLTLNAGLAGARAGFQLSTALEGLLKKLLESPEKISERALLSTVDALDLLADLCVEGINAELGTNPAIRLLVVDDDPIARRALGGALQMVFGKPDMAENGTAALELAGKNAYDVVFLDVMMPDMDGFTLCPLLIETPLNEDTPVIFVTSHATPELIRESVLNGGSDCVSKSYQVAEINLKALVHALRYRLDRPARRPQNEEAVPA